MIPSLRSLSTRSIVALFALVPILVLVCLLLFAPPDGNESSQLLQFVGRFHPLSVHLPIALLILVPLLELAGRSRFFPGLLGCIDFILGIATLGAISAAALGWCLARGGGYSGPLITQHMWGGVSLAGASLLCWTLRPHADTRNLRRLYFALLVAIVGIVSLTGYRGGQVAHGENHLTEFLPTPLRGLLGVSLPADAASPVDPNTFYGARIHPVFVARCVTCHGQNKHKANLRLDSYAGAMRGGKHGAVIKAGEPKGSELLRRVTLPQTDDDFMPAENRRPLSASDIKLIELWIASGASATQPADAVKDMPSTSQPAVAEVTFEDVDPEAVSRQRASLATVVSQLQQKLPNVLDYQSRSSADLVVNTSWMGSRFGDDELAALAPLAERIVIADFSGTSITDRSAGRIAAMKHLRSLRLMHTRITDTTVQALAPLDQLESLSIFDTPVTSAALPAIARLPRLRHVYAGATKLSADAEMPLEIKNKLVF